MKQFSILTLLLTTAIIALSISLYFARLQLSVTQSQMVVMRNELRYLDPSNPEKIRVIEIPAPGRHEWRWKIDLPNDQKFVIQVAYDNIPVDGLPPKPKQSFVQHELPSEELILNVSATIFDGQWEMRWQTDPTSPSVEFGITFPMNARDLSWFDRKSGGHTIHEHAGLRGTDYGEPDSPFVLLRYRKGLRSNSVLLETDPNPTDGLIIWIEPVKNANTDEQNDASKSAMRSFEMESHLGRTR